MKMLRSQRLQTFQNRCKTIKRDITSQKKNVLAIQDISLAWFQARAFWVMNNLLCTVAFWSSNFLQNFEVHTSHSPWKSEGFAVRTLILHAICNIMQFRLCVLHGMCNILQLTPLHFVWVFAIFHFAWYLQHFAAHAIILSAIKVSRQGFHVKFSSFKLPEVPKPSF